MDTTNLVGHAVPAMTRRNRRVWLAKRRKLLGATDAVAVLGYSKFRTPLDVWLEKTGRYSGDDLTGKYVVERGNALEQLIVAEWVNRNDVLEVDYPQLVTHPDYPMLGASLDGIGLIMGGEPVVCEAKAVTWRGREDWWDHTKLCPDQYAVQVLMQLAVCGVEVGHLCADLAGEYRQVEIVRDYDFEAAVLPALAEWWQRHVVEDKEPPVDPIRDYPNLNRVWVPDPGKTLTADGHLAALIGTYQAAALAAQDRKRVLDEIRGNIRVAMRDAAAVTDTTGQRLASIDRRGTLRVAGV